MELRLRWALSLSALAVLTSIGWLQTSPKVDVRDILKRVHREGSAVLQPNSMPREEALRLLRSNKSDSVRGLVDAAKDLKLGRTDRRLAMELLAEVDPRGAVPEVIPMLSNNETASVALGFFEIVRDARAIPAIAKLLDVKVNGDVYGAANVLRLFPQPQAVEAMRSRLAGSMGTVIAFSMAEDRSTMRPILVQALSSEDGAVRSSAFHGLSRKPSVDVAGRLVKIMPTVNWQKWSYEPTKLCVQYKAATLPYVEEHLSASDPELRKWAVETLIEMDFKRGVAAARKALKDPEQVVYRGASHILLSKDLKGSLTWAALQSKKGSLADRRAAAELLSGVWHTGDSFSTLVVLSRDKDVSVRENAVRGLGNLLQAKKQPDSKVEPYLINALKSKDLPVRRIAAFALRFCETKKAKIALQAALKDSNSGVRWYAQKSLERHAEK